MLLLSCDTHGDIVCDELPYTTAPPPHFIAAWNKHVLGSESSTPPKSILEEAATIITGPRRDAYGSVHDSFERVATVWSALLKHPITARDVAHCMIAFKLCRESNKAARDNRVDICGYTALLDQLEASPNEP